MELSAWQRTEDGKKSIAGRKNAAQCPRKRNQGRHSASNNRKKFRTQKRFKKQSADKAALNKELMDMKEKDKEQDLTAEVAALLNASITSKGPNSSENISVARQVMAIVAKKKKEE